MKNTERAIEKVLYKSFEELVYMSMDMETIQVGEDVFRPWVCTDSGEIKVFQIFEGNAVGVEIYSSHQD